MIWKKFKAMGSQMVISADLAEDQKEMLDMAEQMVMDFEKRFSRFNDGNELSRLNDLSGRGFAASDIMIDLLKRSKELYQETNGIFDPTIIGSLDAVGYCANFEDLDQTPQSENHCLDPEKIKRINSSRSGLNELTISGQILNRPANFRLDLGGIGKGYIVDFLADKIFRHINNIFISAGGDLMVRGQAQNEIGWTIGVQDPEHPLEDKFLIKTKGERLAAATSGVTKRRGGQNNSSWHHIIDPRTGLPAQNDILSVTVVSTTTTRADVFAKTVLILGLAEGLKFIEEKKDSACIIFQKGQAPVWSRNANKYL